MHYNSLKFQINKLLLSRNPKRRTKVLFYQGNNILRDWCQQQSITSQAQLMIYILMWLVPKFEFIKGGKGLCLGNSKSEGI